MTDTIISQFRVPAADIGSNVSGTAKLKATVFAASPELVTLANEVRADTLAAEASEQAAGLSEDASSVSEDNASASENAAANSATASSNSAGYSEASSQDASSTLEDAISILGDAQSISEAVDETYANRAIISTVLANNMVLLGA